MLLIHISWLRTNEISVWSILNQRRRLAGQSGQAMNAHYPAQQKHRVYDF